MWQNFKSALRFWLEVFVPAWVGAFITGISILLASPSLSSLPPDPTLLTPDHIEQLNMTFGYVVLLQTAIMSFLTLWLTRGRMNFLRIAIIVFPPFLIYVLRRELAAYLDILLALAAWLTLWFAWRVRAKRR